MKAEEIRKFKMTPEQAKRCGEDSELLSAAFLQEIAAQLSEASESLKYLAHPLMEVKSAEQAAGEKTLRDEFAMAALQGLMMANYQDCPFPGGYAEEAYKVADSMLEARKK